jgi:metallo-beta-lactamase family protein
MTSRGDSTALRFLGGAGTVTGSKTVVETTTTSVMVDCGLFQGERDLRRRNWAPLDVDAGTVSAVLLTHAHLDHCGYLPKLCRDGFHGRVLATRTTEELARIVLMDSAHLLEEEARHALDHGWSKHAAPRPLYDTEDALRAISRFAGVAFAVTEDVAGQVRATWRPAGHVLGSSIVHVETPGGSVLFSGDLGRAGHPLLRPPSPPPAADVIVVESTYGDRVHGDRDPAVLADVVNRTVARGGSVLIPAFAVDRTEIVLCALRDLMGRGDVPQVPVLVDSPMALRALDVYREALERGDPDVISRRATDFDPFDTGDLRALRTPEESRAANAPAYPCIIVSASGMATGGRVLHHLEAQLPDPRNTVALVGYQAIGTRGRQLQDGARSIKIHGRYVPVRAEVADLQGFSVHADADDLIAWLGSCPEEPQCCFVVHGEPTGSEALRHRIDEELGWNAVVPRPGERVLLR